MNQGPRPNSLVLLAPTWTILSAQVQMPALFLQLLWPQTSLLATMGLGSLMCKRSRNRFLSRREKFKLGDQTERIVVVPVCFLWCKAKDSWTMWRQVWYKGISLYKLSICHCEDCVSMDKIFKTGSSSQQIVNVSYCLLILLPVLLLLSCTWQCNYIPQKTPHTVSPAHCTNVCYTHLFLVPPCTLDF